MNPTLINVIKPLLIILFVIFLSKRKSSHIISINKFLDKLMSNRAARIVLIVFWWCFGWHFFITAPLYLINKINNTYVCNSSRLVIL